MLIGVAVGAIVAGLGQVLNAWLQDWRGRKGVLREERRRAYVGMIGSSSQAQATIDLIDSGTRRDVRLQRDLVDARKKAAQVRLVGPMDTAVAAQQLLNAIVRLDCGETETIDVDTYRDEFLALAQRDLKIPAE